MFKLSTFQFYVFSCSIIFLFIACHQDKNKNQNHSANGTSSAANYTFGLHLKAGDQYYYTINNTTAVTVDFDGKKINNNNVSNIGLLYRVIADTANKYVVQITYKKLHTVAKKGAATEEMDADNKYSFNDNEKLLSALKDQSITITINQKGELLSVGGYKEIADHITAQLPQTNEEESKELQSKLASMLGESFIKSNVGANASLFPSHSIQPGDDWTKETTETTPFPIKGTTHYQLDDVDDNMAKITASSELVSSSGKTQIMGAEAMANLKGKSKSNYKLNTVTGIVVNEKATSNLEGTMQVMGREVPIEVSVEKMVEVKKL